jgi:hypothetical protein
MTGGGADNASEKFVIPDQCSLGPRVPHAIQEKIDSIVFVVLPRLGSAGFGSALPAFPVIQLSLA